RATLQIVAQPRRPMRTSGAQNERATEPTVSLHRGSRPLVRFPHAGLAQDAHPRSVAAVRRGAVVLEVARSEWLAQPHRCPVPAVRLRRTSRTHIAITH